MPLQLRARARVWWVVVVVGGERARERVRQRGAETKAETVRDTVT